MKGFKVLLIGLLVCSSANAELKCGSYTYGDLVRDQLYTSPQGVSRYHTLNELRSFQDDMQWKIYDLNESGRISECISAMTELNEQTKLHIRHNGQINNERRQRYRENYQQRHGNCSKSPSGMFRGIFDC